MNVELLRAVQKTILEEPLRIDMESWAREDNTVPCGTAGCIFGWGMALTTNLRKNELIAAIWPEVAFAGAMATSNIFDLTPRQKDVLFYLDNWPAYLQHKLLGLKEQTPEYAAVVSERIDRFIASDGQDGIPGKNLRIIEDHTEDEYLDPDEDYLD